MSPDSYPSQTGQTPGLRTSKARPAQGTPDPCRMTTTCTEAADEPSSTPIHSQHRQSRDWGNSNQRDSRSNDRPDSKGLVLQGRSDHYGASGIQAFRGGAAQSFGRWGQSSCQGLGSQNPSSSSNMRSISQYSSIRTPSSLLW